MSWETTVNSAPVLAASPRRQMCVRVEYMFYTTSHAHCGLCDQKRPMENGFEGYFQGRFVCGLFGGELHIGAEGCLRHAGCLHAEVGAV